MVWSYSVGGRGVNEAQSLCIVLMLLYIISMAAHSTLSTSRSVTYDELYCFFLSSSALAVVPWDVFLCVNCIHLYESLD